MNTKPWAETDLLCVLSGKESLTRFHWMCGGQKLCKKMTRDVDGDQAFEWLKKSKIPIEDKVLRTVTEEFYLENV